MKFTTAILALATLTSTASAAAIDTFSDAAALEPRQLIVCPAHTKGPICCDDDPNLTNTPDKRTGCRTLTKVNVALGLGCSSNPQCCKSFDAKAAVAKGCTNGQGVV